MKNLFLIRHAKSCWTENVADELRTITTKGQTKTQKVAHYLQENYALQIDQIFCSTAIRAQETSKIVQPILFPSQEIVLTEELYTFSSFKLDQWVRRIDNQYQNVLIFGHNPAFTDLINQLGNEMIYNLSTSGFVWLQFNSIDWKNINKGETIKIILPKDI